jgi:hypothetical protein
MVDLVMRDYPRLYIIQHDVELQQRLLDMAARRDSAL